MPKFALIQDGFRRRLWEISILILIQTSFPMTGHRSETTEQGESEKQEDGSHLEGG